uniref:Uncharacterized protein n=1 Tax=Balaenoptera musculus TaxID=9771 RepID=A0A8C0DYF6_BALMU
KARKGKKKKAKKNGNTISLTGLQAEDGNTGGSSISIPKPVSWIDKTDDLEDTRTIILLAEKEIRFLTKPIQTGGTVLP